MGDGSSRALRRCKNPSVHGIEAAVVRVLAPHIEMGKPLVGSSDIICDLVEYDLLDWVMKTEPSMAHREAVAENVKEMVRRVHATGCTFHDLKLENIGLRPGTTEVQLLDYNAVSVGPWDGTGGTWYASGEWTAIKKKQPYDHKGTGDRFRLGVLLFGLLCDRQVPHVEEHGKQGEIYRVRYGLLPDHISRYTRGRPHLQELLTNLLVPSGSGVVTSTE